MRKRLALIVLTSVLAAPLWAAPQTVTLAVSKMTCAACPITVKTALSRVPGVTRVSVSPEKKQATVQFDDSQTNVQALTKAAEDAGYPSSVTR